MANRCVTTCAYGTTKIVSTVEMKTPLTIVILSAERDFPSSPCSDRDWQDPTMVASAVIRMGRYRAFDASSEALIRS